MYLCFVGLFLCVYICTYARHLLDHLVSVEALRSVAAVYVTPRQLSVASERARGLRRVPAAVWAWA